MFAKIRRWLKKLWQQLLGKPPQPSPPGAGTLGGKPTDERRRLENKPLSDADYEFLFMQLLEGVEHGWQYARVSRFLSDLNNCTSEAELVGWLRRFGSKLLKSQETNWELAQQMVQLGEIVDGELGDVIGKIGKELLQLLTPALAAKVTNNLFDSFINKFYLLSFGESGKQHNFKYTRKPNRISTNLPKDELVQKLMQEGHDYVDRDEYTSALKVFYQASELEPQNSYILYSIGVTYFYKNSYWQAIEYLSQALQVEPSYILAWAHRGMSYEKLNQTEQAKENFEQALKIEPQDDEDWRGWGCALDGLKRYEEAIASFDKAIELNPSNDYAWNERGITLIASGNYLEAFLAYNRSLELNPYSSVVWSNRGLALYEINFYRKAIDSFDIALLISQNQLWYAWRDRGWAIYKLQGYQAAIENWDSALKAISPNDLENRSRLHKIKGDAYLLRGHSELNPFSYWQKARNSYISALQILSDSQTSLLGEVFRTQVGPDFQLLYLEILQDIAKVCNALSYQDDFYQDDFQLCLDIGDTMLENLLLETDSQERKIQLANKFATFSQLRVVLLAESSQPKEALLLAEKRKNLCLRWLRESRYVGMKDETPLQYPEIEKFLSPSMAAIYWHYSPAAITTFSIKHNDIQIHSPENTAVKQLEKFEDWLEAWKEDYQTNRKDAKNAKEEKETWREKMADRLDDLGKILDVEGILNKIGDDITDLILIPHRDLHLLPLHYLWREKDFTITYLPSLKVGIDLQTDTPSTRQKLLSIESPSRLEYAETESQIIAQLYDNPTWIKSSKATKNTVIAAFSNSADIFHFTGHGEHNIARPLESALELANKEKLTLQDIFQLNLKGYQLACLSACETGITSKQGIIDEYVGLVSGFLAKGVTHVVSTLWQVGEIETALMMIKFHQLYKDNIPPALALQQTKTWLSTLTFADLIQWYRQESAKLEEGSGCWESLQGAIIKAQQEAEIKGINYLPYAHPYHWAGFIVSGNHKNPIVSYPLDYP